MALAAITLYWIGPLLTAQPAWAPDSTTSVADSTLVLHSGSPLTQGKWRVQATGPIAATTSAPELYAHVAATYGPAVVTIKFVQKTQGRFGEVDDENEINGTMIEPGGLVLCSNLLLGAGAARRGGRSVPTDIRVLVGDDVTGVPARFVARDSELDLAWLRVEQAAGRNYSYVDLEAAVRQDGPAGRPHIGQRVLALGLMGRYFGQAVLVTEGQIAGKTRKPRELYVVRGAIDTDPGMPVFDAGARVVGFACLQQPSPDEVSGNLANLLARGRGLILPIEVVYKATLRARDVEADEPVVDPPDEPENPEGEPERDNSGDLLDED